MKEFLYCYQCKHSSYHPLNKVSLIERYGQEKICLYCPMVNQFMSKNAEVGDCVHAERVSLDPIVSRVNRERGGL